MNSEKTKLTKSQLKAIRRKEKYDYIIHNYADYDSAYEGRDWGWNTIYKRLGLKKPSPEQLKRVPDANLRQLKDKTVRKKTLQLDKVKIMLEYGFMPEQVFRQRKKSKKYIESQTKTLNIFGSDLKIAYPDERDDRFEIWKYWSDRNEPNNMPSKIKDMAHRINREYKTNSVVYPSLDINDHYGFTFVYFMFVNEKKDFQVEEMIDPDLTQQYKVEYKEASYVAR
jgi:hypothetical protein